MDLEVEQVDKAITYNKGKMEAAKKRLMETNTKEAYAEFVMRSDKIAFLVRKKIFLTENASIRAEIAAILPEITDISERIKKLKDEEDISHATAKQEELKKRWDALQFRLEATTRLVRQNDDAYTEGRAVDAAGDIGTHAR